MDKSREFGGTPVVKLGDQFKKVAVSVCFYDPLIRWAELYIGGFAHVYHSEAWEIIPETWA